MHGIKLLYKIQYLDFLMEELCVLGEVRTIYLCGLKYLKPITVAARSKAWVCGRSLSGILGSNPTGRMIYVLYLL